MDGRTREAGLCTIMAQWRGVCDEETPLIIFNKHDITLEHGERDDDAAQQLMIYLRRPLLIILPVPTSWK